MTEKRNSALSIISLVMGILSITLGCCTGLGIFFAIAGLVCGIIAKTRKEGGLATAGIVCSVIGIVIPVILIVLAFVSLNWIASDPVLYEEFMKSYEQSLQMWGYYN